MQNQRSKLKLYNMMFLLVVVASGHPEGGKRREERCPECEEELKRMDMRPAYPCDAYSEGNTCWLERTVGETLTLVVESRTPVHWALLLTNRDPRASKKYLIQPELPPWNVVVGSKGRELRLSPITEMDVDCNAYVATNAHAHSLVFRIRLVPIELGFVYPGEGLWLNMESFVSLPLESLLYEWSTEGGRGGGLPSNMRAEGGLLRVNELRREQEGVLACSAFSNQGFFVARRRFRLRNFTHNDVLMEKLGSPTPPPPPPVKSIMGLRMVKEHKYSREKDEAIEVKDEVRIQQQQQPPLKPAPPTTKSLLHMRGMFLVRDKRIAQQDATTKMEEDVAMTTTSEAPPSLVIEVLRGAWPESPEDEISRLVSGCSKGAECSGHASCVEDGGRGYCRCHPAYYGNGISCWEDVSLKRLLANAPN